MTGLPAALLAELDKAGGAQIDNVVAALLPDPDAAPDAPPPMPPNAVNYAICYVQRSGSTHLTSLLQNTGIAGRPADFFNAAYRYMPAEEQQVLQRTGVHTIATCAEQYNCKSVAGYLDTVASLTRSANGVFGLKMDLCHASILVRRGLFWNPAWNWKYIYLVRRDLLLQSISHYRAHETGVWSSLSVGEDDTPFCEHAVTESMLYLANLMRLWECLFAALGVEPLRITYEELEARPQQTLARCLQHIGVEFTREQLCAPSVYSKQRTCNSEQWAAAFRAQSRGQRAAATSISGVDGGW